MRKTMHVLEQGIYGNSVPSPQVCCEPETALKNRLNIYVKKERAILTEPKRRERIPPWRGTGVGPEAEGGGHCEQRLPVSAGRTVRQGKQA